MNRLLVVALSGLVIAPLVGLQGGAAQAADPVGTVTTISVSPAAPVYGDTITVRANVTQAGGGAVPVGSLKFDIAPTEADLWGGEVVDIFFGQILVEESAEGVELTLDEEVVDFLTEESEGFWLSAEYVPSDDDESYEDQFNGSLSAPLFVPLPGPPPESPVTTTTVTGPGAALVDMPTSLVAAVTPKKAAGTVQFSVDGELVGAPVPVNGGAASLTHSFPMVGASWVGATFTPAEPDWYDPSRDADGLQVMVEPGTSSIVVTGPGTATVGEETMLTATVQPSDATGTVTFLVDGEEAMVGLDDGEASVEHTFESAGASTVVALFEPTTGNHGPTTSAAHTVTVEEGASAEEYEHPFTVPRVSFGRGCKAAPGATDAGRAGAPNGFFWPGQMPGGAPIFDNLFTFTPFSLVPSFIKPLYSWFTLTLNFEVCVLGLGFSVGPYGNRAREVPTVVTGTVQCVPTETGYACPFAFPKFEAIKITADVPLPAAFGGQQVNIESKLTSTDPATGETTTLVTHDDLVQVPKRTALTAKLAPVKSGLTSIKRGKNVAYRVDVRNAGVVTAKGVRTCVSLGKGAKVVSAKKADVRGRQACWTVPTLKGDTSVTRTLTLRAPTKSGPLKIVAKVTPKKTQAAPVRLTSILDVR